MAKKSTDSQESTTALQVAEQPRAETSLAVLEQSKFLALRPNSELREAFEANYAAGETMKFSDLIRVKNPSGGATKWTVEELTGEAMYDEIVGVPVYYKPAGTLWPSEDLQDGIKPLLRTNDLLTAEQVGDDYGDINPDVLEEARIFIDGEPASTPDGRGLYDWQKLAYNQWGTGKKGNGKRCKESRLLCILREEDQFPLFLQIQPGSLKDVTSFFRKLPGAHYRFVIGLSLEKAKSKDGIAFSKVKCRLVSKLSDAEALTVKSTYTDMLGGAVNEAVSSAEIYSESDDSDVSF